MANLTQQTRPDADKILMQTPDNLGLVSTWSYSALKTFEQCAYRTYLQKVRNIKEPTNPAAQRGSDIHQQAEDYVKGELGEFPDTLSKFKYEFEELRELFIDSKVELEGEWGYNANWEPCAWMERATWVRIKLDALVHQDDTSLRVIDYKTGKRWGNEVAHGQQALLYAIGTFLRYPHAEFAQTELWYLDKKETFRKTYTRDEALMFMPGWHSRGVKMTTAEDFTPNPSKHNCRWCSYGKGEEPVCNYGIY